MKTRKPNQMLITLLIIIRVISQGYLFFKQILQNPNGEPTEEAVIFTDLYGKKFSLTTQEIYEIIELYDKRVLPYVIADKHGLSMDRLIRVLSFVKNNKHLNIKK